MKDRDRDAIYILVGIALFFLFVCVLFWQAAEYHDIYHPPDKPKIIVQVEPSKKCQSIGIWPIIKEQCEYTKP